jgi:MFS family permease
MSFTSSAPQWRDLYVAAAAKAVSTCGDMLAATALALVLQSRGYGGGAVAALLLAAALPVMGFGPIGGWIADRFDSRSLLISTGAVQVLACVGLAYVTSPVAIVALVAVLSVGLAVTMPVMSALTPLMVGRDNLAKAGGVIQTTGTLGMLAAPALGGVLVGAFGPRTPLLIDAVTYLAIPIAGLVIRTRRGGGVHVTSNPAAASAVEAPSSGYRLRNDGLIWPLLSMVAASIAAISAVNVIDVFFVRESLHSTAAMYGIVAASWIGGMVIGSAAASRLRFDDTATARALFFLLAVAGADIVLAGAARSVWWLLPVWLVGGVINGGINVNLGVMLGRRVPAEVRGHAGGVFNSVASGANAFGYLLGGVLLTVASPRSLIVACGLAGVAVLIPFGAPLRKALAREQRHALSTAAATSPASA